MTENVDSFTCLRSRQNSLQRASRQKRVHSRL
jgi:hypothetical protein